MSNFWDISYWLTLGAGQTVRRNAGDTAYEAFTAGVGNGDVVGPASATDNAIARYDSTTGKLIQNSSVIINDNWATGLGAAPTGSFDVNALVYNPGTVSVTGTAVTGTSTEFTKTFKPGDSITTTTTSGSETKEINSITSDTAMTTVAFNGTSTNTTYTSSNTGSQFVILPNGTIRMNGTLAASQNSTSVDYIYKADTISFSGANVYAMIRDASVINNTGVGVNINTFNGVTTGNSTGAGTIANFRGFNVASTLAGTNTGNVTTMIGYADNKTIASGASGIITNFIGFQSAPNQNSSSITITNYYGAQFNTTSSVGTVTNSIGIAVGAKAAVAINSVLGLFGTTTAPTGNFGLYVSSTADNYLAGNLGIGVVAGSDTKLFVSGNHSSATTAFGIDVQGTVTSATTTAMNLVRAVATTSAVYTLPVLNYFSSVQSSFGSTTVTEQRGFIAGSSSIGATNNMGFYAANTAAVASGKTAYGYYSAINTATGGGTTYGLYMAGTAQNYMAWNLGIGTITPSEKLHIASGGAEFAMQWGSTGSKSWVLASASNRAYIRNKTDSVEVLTILNGGNLGIGVTAPTATLHLKAGTATASTAPIKLTAGTALTTPEDGAIEYHSSHLYFTIASTRYQLDQQGGGGISWNATVNGATGTGLALTMNNSYAASGIGQSITISNTQTNALTGLKIDTGTSAIGHTGLSIVGDNNSASAYMARLATTTGSFSGFGLSIETAALGNPKSAFQLDYSANGTLTAYTNSTHFVQTRRIHSWATSVTDNFNNCNLQRTNQNTNAGGTLLAQGSVLRVANTATPTSGTLTDTVAVLSLVQSNNSVGGHILFNAYSGTPTPNNTFWYDGTNFKYKDNAGTTKTITAI